MGAGGCPSSTPSDDVEDAAGSDAHLRGVVTPETTASRAMPCGWPPPLPGVRGLHLDTEAQSFPKARESAVMTVRAACGVRPVGPIPRPRSCDVHVQADAPDDESADRRDEAHPIRNGLTISRSR